MAKKTFDIFKRLGRNEPFLGKNMVKKRNIVLIHGKLRNFFPISLGKAWESLKTRKWERGDGAICGNSPPLSVCERGFLP